MSPRCWPRCPHSTCWRSRAASPPWRRSSFITTTMATVAPAPSEPRARALGLLARRALRDSRVRTIGFAYLFAAMAYLQPVAYRHTYPSLVDRLGFASSFAHNNAVVLFYGKAYDL